MKSSLVIKFLPFATAVIMAGCSENNDYDATGIFEATTVTVSAETSGRILSFPVEEGDSVYAGQQVAQIDSTMLMLQLAQLGSQRQSAISSSPDIAAQVASVKAQIAHAEEEKARVERLFASGAATQKQYDDAAARLSTLQGQIQGMTSTLSKNRSAVSGNASAIQYQREQIEQQIERCRILAPESGTILCKYAQRGEFAAPGKPLFKMADLNRIFLRSYFTASQLADIRIGQKVTVTADFGGDSQFEYPGVITWISQESEFTPKSIQTRDSRANLVYAVKIAVKNDGRQKLGQYGEVSL